ncbi:MAG: biotin--[acetyl-CoA-carboxylase] ligase [Acidobacteriota bacterium]|nr:biotin--[acetyl-CoA-carboxylase] ligase [Acidobacteriota bacterium]
MSHVTRARRIVRFDRVGSTMVEAALLAAEGCAPGTAVVADEQTAGQGRHGHSWHSEPGSGLYVSIVLDAARDAPPDPVLTLALGLATSEAIARETDIRCDLRWPNDVMIGEKKVAGILVQLAGATAIAGIGINVNHQAFPVELSREATSLRIETGRSHNREELLAELLRSVDSFSGMLRGGGKASILRQFTQASSYANGKRVTVQMGGRVVEGVSGGLDDSGFLRLRKDDGTVESIIAGGVRPKL